MKSSTQRFLGALLSILVLSVAFVVLFELVEPAYQNLQSLKGKVAGEESFLGVESSTIAQAEKIAQSYEAQADAQASVDAAFPVGQNISGAIAQLYGIAQTSGISLQNVTIAVSPPTGGQAIASVGSNGIVTTGASIVQPTGTIAFSLAATGNYESFKNFLSSLETNVRIFDVKQVNIAPSISLSGSRATSSQDFFAYSMTVDAYYQSP